jgi:hypothetical protein
MLLLSLQALLCPRLCLCLLWLQRLVQARALPAAAEAAATESEGVHPGLLDLLVMLHWWRVLSCSQQRQQQHQGRGHFHCLQLQCQGWQATPSGRLTGLEVQQMSYALQELHL